MGEQPTIEIGRLLRAGVGGFIIGCRTSQMNIPSFGALVSVPVKDDRHPDYRIYGLIHDIRIDDDGLVRQLVGASYSIDESVIEDNRVNRNMPLEMSVLAVGHHIDGKTYHLLPPRPPLSLEKIYLCDQDEIYRFTSAGHFGYFRLILRAHELPIPELLAAHLQQTQEAQTAKGIPDWADRATQELITLLRDDYSTLMNVLGALSDALIR